MFGKNLTSKRNKNKRFHGFHVFEYALWLKNENPETLEINRKLCKARITHC